MTKKVEVDEISIKDLTKTIAKSTGNKNLNNALKKSKDQTKMDLAALRKKLQAEKTLTPAEIKKREEIAKAMERDNPDMPMAKKMAIATATAKKVAEDFDLDEGAKEKALKALMTRALGGKRAKPGYTSAVANNGDFVVKDGGGRIVGRIKSGDYTNPLKEKVEELDEISADLAKRALQKRDKQADQAASGMQRARDLKKRSLDKAKKTSYRTMGTNMSKDREIKKHTDTAKKADATAANLRHSYATKSRKADKTYDYMKKRGMKTESVELEENKALMKDYQALKAKGKKDSQALDYLMSMPKYKRMSKDQMAKVIGDAKRKGIFKEETLQENRVDALAKDFHNRLKKAGNSDRNQSRERYTTLAKAKKQGLSPIEMKQLDGKMNAVMNKMDESVNEISAKKYHAALKGREYKRDRARNSAAANQFVGKDAEAQADMAKSKDHDRKLKKMKQMGINRTARNLGEKAPKIDDAKYAAHMDRLKKPKKMSSTQKSLADIRKRAEK